MLHYVIQTIVFQLFFLLVFEFVLKRETFFNWNRAYLLITVILSFVLPFIKVESFKKAVTPQFAIALPEVFLGQTNNIIQLNAVTINTQNTQVVSLFTWQNLFYLGVFVALIVFVIKLTKLVVLIKNNQKTKYENLSLITLFKSTNAFSFFNYVFLGEQLTKQEKNIVLQHEKVHGKPKTQCRFIIFRVTSYCVLV